MANKATITITIDDNSTPGNTSDDTTETKTGEVIT